MSFTTHEQLEKLAQGALDWDSTLNTNFDKRESGRHLNLYAGEAISSLQVVYLESTSGYMLLADDPKEHIGICPSAITSGSQGQVRILGIIEDDGWSWSVGPVYVSSSSAGDLTQTAPGSASVPIAYAYSATGIVIMESPSIKIALEVFNVEHNHMTGVHDFASYVGTFTVNASLYTFIANTNVIAGSVIAFTPTNTVAAGLQAGASAIYVSTISPGSGFGISTADGGDGAGTETFNYHYFS